ncbi:MAG TPA: hypothetical protein VFI46_07365 [Jiangellaceae bacterium]|nr:hypothetical protein [Jiangellaceae bacterium]
MVPDLGFIVERAGGLDFGSVVGKLTESRRGGVAGMPLAGSRRAPAGSLGRTSGHLAAFGADLDDPGFVGGDHRLDPTCVMAVASLITSRWAISWLDRPSAMSVRTSDSQKVRADSNASRLC